MGYANQATGKRAATSGTSAAGAARAARTGREVKVRTAKPERPHQRDVMHRLRRVEGQIRGILAMMEKDEPCDAIAQQLSAARKALDRAFYEMMACSLETEIMESLDAGDLTERIAEKTRLLAKYA